MTLENKQLKDFLIDTGLITKTEYKEAEELSKNSKYKETPEKILISHGKISEDDLQRAKSHIFGTPFVDLRNKNIDLSVFSIIPEPIARKNNIVAFKKGDAYVEIAMLDIKDLQAVDFVKTENKLKILPRLTDTSSIKSAILQYQKKLKKEFGDLIKKDLETLEHSNDLPKEGLTEKISKNIAENPRVIHLVETLFKHAVLQKVSDIHIESLEKDVLIRYRIDGQLYDAMLLPKNIASGISARIKALSNIKFTEKNLPLDGKFNVNINEKNISFKVSTIPTYFGEKIVLRLYEGRNNMYSFESLGFHGMNLETIHEALKLKNGMILVAGPTGSGTTTTLYSMLESLNSAVVDIVTIEDPIEYQITRINQTQVKPEIGFTFANGLRSILKQDADIIMVGEIKDNETATLSTNAAFAGRLILSSLQSSSAANAIAKLKDMKIEDFFLASTLNVILGQRLARKLTKNKEKYILSKTDRASLEKVADLKKVLSALRAENIVGQKDDWDNIYFYKAKESSESKDGYLGKIGIQEILKVTPVIKELIAKGADSKEIEKQAKKEGMMTMIEDGIFKCVTGMTTIEEVLRVVNEL